MWVFIEGQEDSKAVRLREPLYMYKGGRASGWGGGINNEDAALPTFAL